LWYQRVNLICAIFLWVSYIFIILYNSDTMKGVTWIQDQVVSIDNTLEKYVSVFNAAIKINNC